MEMSPNISNEQTGLTNRSSAPALLNGLVFYGFYEVSSGAELGLYASALYGEYGIPEFGNDTS